MQAIRTLTSRATHYPFRIPLNKTSFPAIRKFCDLPEKEVYIQQDKEDDTIAKLILNRPKAANALGREFMAQLNSTLSLLKDENSSFRCVVITSTSPKVFCAGADLRERAKMTDEEAVSFVDSLRNTFEDIADFPMPVLAAIEGAALGGGLELALAADIRIASKSSSFGLVETSLAIVPGAGGTQRLPRLIGVSRAKELIFTARRFDAMTALEYGVVDHLVEEGEAETKALSIAREIAKNGPLAIRNAKLAIQSGIQSASMKDALDIERQCYRKIIPTSDRLEGLAAFREKRKPVYRGE